MKEYLLTRAMKFMHMKSGLLSAVFILSFFLPGQQGWAQQELFLGMNYQGVARSVEGGVLVNQPLLVRLSFSSKNEEAQTYYSELHRVVTDDLGLFRFVIGRGEATLANSLSDIPWSSQNIWLDLEISDGGMNGFKLMGSTELLTVPYAFYAESAGSLVKDEELDLRSATPGPSIRWTVSGNAYTRPPFHFVGSRDDQSVVFKTNDEVRLIITNTGQVQLISGVGTMDGAADDDVTNYPLFISGSEQGIYIKVNGDRDSGNNFMTFADDGPGLGGGVIWGRVEGQTLDELTSSDAFIRQNALFALKLASLAATSTGLGIKAAGLYAAGTGAAASLIFAFAAPGFYAAATAVVAQAVVVAVELAALTTQVVNFNVNAINNVGVVYSTGGADYAEYLPRAPGERDLLFGEIVGVRGGIVSLNTDQADHRMVVSSMPGFLGNAPNNGTEASMEKIAFLGQVPVRVVGPVQVGDYIIPSGNNDGMGTAVAPDQLPVQDYHRIVGVAWQAGDDPVLNIINCGVGLHKNRLAGEVQKITEKVDAIEAYLRGEAPLPNSGDETIPITVHQQKTQPITAYGPLMDDAAFDQFVEGQADYLQTLYSHLGKVLTQKGYDLDDHPVIEKFVNDPVQAYKDLRRDPTYRSYWGRIDRILLESN